MADVTSRLRLVVDSTGVDRSGKALRDLRGEAARVEAQAKAMRSAFAGLATVLGAAFSVQAVVNYADAWKRAENQIKTVQASLGQVRSAQEGVFAVAQKTFAAYDATAALYTKLTRAGAGLISGQKEALRLVETVNKALAVGGASASERNSVILQLGQAVGSGRLQGDEFRSISENAPLILDALAKSTGRARGELKQLGSEGKITSEVLIKAIRDYSDEIDKTFGQFAPTIGDSLNQLSNAFQKLVGEQGAPAFTAIAAAIGALSANLDLAAKAALIALPAIAGPSIIAGLGAVAKGIQAIGLAVAANPLGALAIGLATVATAFYAFSDQIKVAGADTEKFGITVQDVFNEIPGVVADSLGEAVESSKGWIAGLFGEVQVSEIDGFWSNVGAIVKSEINLIIGYHTGLVQTIRKVMGNLPAILGDIALTAANAFLAGLSFMINQAIAQINAFGKLAQTGLSRVGVNIDVPQVANVNFKVDNQFKGAVADAQKPLVGGLTGQIDYLGDLWDKAAAKAVNSARKQDQALRGGGDGEGGGSAAGAASGAGGANQNDRLKKLFSGLDSATKKMDEFKASLEYGLVNPLEGLGKTAESISDRTVAALNAVSSQARLFAALGGGIEAYRDQLAAEEAIEAAKRSGVILDQKGLDAAVARARMDRKAAEDFDKLYRQKERLYYLEQKQVVAAADNATTDVFDRFFDALPTKGLEAFKDLFDDIGDIFKQVWSDAMKAALDPFVQKLKAELSKAFEEVFATLKGVFSRALDGISDGLGKKLSSLFASASKAYAAYQVGSGVSSALGGNKTAAQQQNGQIGAAVGAILGSVIPGIGTILGSFIGTTLGGLLGPGSTNAAASSLLDSSGKSTSGLLGTKRTNETSQAVNDFITVLGSGYTSLKELGGTISTYVRNIEIGTRDASKIDLSDGRQVRSAVGDTAAAQNAALIEVLRGTTFAVEALNKIKDGMIKAGSSFEVTYDALVKVNGLLEASKPKLSEFAQELKTLIDGFAPLIASTSAYSDEVKKALAANVNQTVADKIKALINSPTDQLNDLLRAQSQELEKVKEAGGDVAQYQRLAALQQREFFKGLSESALKEVEGFLGLFDEATNSVVRNVDLSRQDLRSRADAFGAFAEQFKTLNSDLTQKYLVASPRESIDGLRGRVQELLGGVAGGNESAAQALPQVVNQLVDAARASFGNTKAFSDVLAFAQSALSSAQESAVKVQTDAERQIAALDENNDILADIRDILSSSQASSAFYQSYLNGGVATSDALIAAIQKGGALGAAANDNASALSITGLIAQSIQPVIAPLAASINTFTERLADMPNLQRLTISAVERGADRVVVALQDVGAKLDRLEQLEKRQLVELEQANAA